MPISKAKGQDGPMWHRYNERLREAVLLAADQAMASGRREFSTANLLLALTTDPAGLAARILARRGIDLTTLHSSIKNYETRETPTDSCEAALTRDARETVDRAYMLAAEIGDSSIGDEHLLLAFVQEPDRCDAGRVLSELGLTWDSVGTALMEVEGWRAEPPPGIVFSNRGIRRAKQSWQRAMWRARRLAHVLSRPTQPFVYYIFRKSGVKNDPYRFYVSLRRSPLYWDSLIQRWVVTGYEEVSAALAETRLSHQSYPTRVDEKETIPPFVQHEFRRLTEVVGSQMLFLDAPEQTRQRSLVARQFTPAVIAHLRDQIQQVTDELLDLAEKKGRMDVIADFAVPLPLALICRLLGVPESDSARFKRWSDSYIAYIAGETSLSQDLQAYRDVQELTDYFGSLILTRRQQPKDDLVTMLLQADEDGVRLSDGEVIANCLLLLAGGHENTTRLIGNGLLALMEHPEQFKWLREDLSRAPAAIEELLRYDSPVQWTERVVGEDFVWREKSFQKGQLVILGLAAANRDPAQFPNADRLELDRSPNKHLAFGNGPHYCLGAALTRLEGQIALGTLISRFPRLRRAGPPVRQPGSLTFRGLQSLPISLS
ncbi:MAG TPA: cytochrome P450 [Capsulimonadaceae bacterium]|nr:cytochrome P450 [Capsulimonadaceae bacterium]